MRILYTCPVPFDWCPVCGKVIRAAKETGIDYQRKIGWFPRSLRKEVIRLTGQNRVPVLIEDSGFVLHESREIDAYLRKTYGTKAPESGEAASR